MKIRFTLVIILSTLISFSTTAQEKKIKDRRTRPDLYYLQDTDVANSLDLLPPPPQPTDILFLYDKAQYEMGKMIRNTPRGEQAVRDASLGGNGISEAFSESFGTHITKEKTPHIYKLLTNMIEE